MHESIQSNFLLLKNCTYQSNFPKMAKFEHRFILAVYLFTVLQISVFLLNRQDANYTYYLQNDISTNSATEPKSESAKVIIAAVCCRHRNQNVINKYSEQTIVLIKSVLISAKLYNISTVEIHLFIEHINQDEKYFRDEIEKLQFPGDQSVELILNVHSAVNPVPRKYRKHMVYHDRYRCGYTRFFYPAVLPNVDSVIHLDTDIVITGNIMKHWQLLSGMDDKQLISMGQDSPVEYVEYNEVYEDYFGPYPHVLPRGVNSGVLVMNLTRMREFDITGKLIRLYNDYSRIFEVDDQRILNILLHFNPGLLKHMPCNLHFPSMYCESGFYCKEALNDPDGVHLVHGLSHRFMKGEVFHPFFKTYNQFNMSDVRSNLVRNLMEPLRQAFSDTTSNTTQCVGTLNKVLFKRFFD